MPSTFLETLGFSSDAEIVSHFAIHDEIILPGLVLCLFHAAGSIPQMSRLVSGQFSEVQSLVFLQRGSGKLPTLVNTFQDQFQFSLSVDCVVRFYITLVVLIFS
jgi:hypothetical protein